MNSDIDEKSTTANDENVPFSQVTAVATEWILDFFFVSLCRQFKEGNLEGFKETMSNFECKYSLPDLTSKPSLNSLK